MLESSPYLEDLKNVIFPKDEGGENLPKDLKDQSEYQWVTAQDTVNHIIKIMIEDLTLSQQTLPVQSNPKNKQTFIVHGKAQVPVDELRSILQDIGITSIILEEQPSKGMTIIEKLETYSEGWFLLL